MIDFFEVTAATSQGSAHLKNLWQLHSEVFGDSWAQKVSREIFAKTKPLILLAVENQQVLGFKTGYERGRGLFYSWSGAVHPKFQNQGLGAELMKRQHQWCLDQGYRQIQTKTKNKWKCMLVLNLKNGFEIVDTYLDEFNELKIVLEKTLTA